MSFNQVFVLALLQHTLIVSATVLVVGCGNSIEADRITPVPMDGHNSDLDSESISNKPNNIIDKTFDDIKFDIEPDAAYDSSMLTDSIRELDGQRIRIRGYILPTARKRGLKEFVLVRDNQECCFGPGAALYDCILVNMTAKQTAEFSVRPVAVEGEFKLSEFIGPDGTPLAIYLLHGEEVN